MVIIDNNDSLGIISSILSPGQLAICEGLLGTKSLVKLDADDLFVLEELQKAREGGFANLIIKIHEGKVSQISVETKKRSPYKEGED